MGPPDPSGDGPAEGDGDKDGDKDGDREADERSEGPNPPVWRPGAEPEAARSGSRPAARVEPGGATPCMTGSGCGPPPAPGAR